MKRLRKITRLPERSDEYEGLECSAHRCRLAVEYMVSYPWRGTTADRKYCRGHTKGFAKRYGLRAP